jgi:hypothetical protein
MAGKRGSMSSWQSLLSSHRKLIANCLGSLRAWPTGYLRARRRASAACLLSGEAFMSWECFIWWPKRQPKSLPG